MSVLDRWQGALIGEHCSDFLSASNSSPLLKRFPVAYQDFQKVKVRKKKGDEFDDTFNEAFEPHELRQRALFANGPSAIEPATNDESEPYFIFPINGFKYMYNKSVINSSDEYRQVFDIIFDNFQEDQGKRIFIEMLQFAYKDNDLCSGIESGSEIIIYDIPFMYVIRSSKFVDYQHLLAEIG